MFLSIKIVFATIIIAIVSYINIDAIWAWVSGLEASIFIALIALLFSIWQGFEIRKHNRLSAYTRIMGGSFDKNVPMRDNMRHIGFQITNHGNSLAIIKNAILFFDGKEVLRNDGSAYIDFISAKTKNFEDVILRFVVSDGFMGKGEKLILWELKYDTETYNIDDIQKLDLQIEYESIYQDKTFIFDSRDDFETHSMKP